MLRKFRAKTKTNKYLQNIVVLTLVLLSLCLYTKYSYDVHNTPKYVTKAYKEDVQKYLVLAEQLHKGKIKETQSKLKAWDDLNFYKEDSVIAGANRYIEYIPDSLYGPTVALRENGCFVLGQLAHRDQMVQYVFPVFLKAPARNLNFANNFPNHQDIAQSFFLGVDSTEYTVGSIQDRGHTIYINDDQNLLISKSNPKLNTFLVFVLAFLIYLIFSVYLYQKRRRATAANIRFAFLGYIAIYLLIAWISPLYTLRDVGVFQEESLVSVLGFASIADYFYALFAFNFFMSTMISQYLPQLTMYFRKYKRRRLIHVIWLTVAIAAYVFFVVMAVDLVYNSTYNYYLLDSYPFQAKKFLYIVIFIVGIYPSFTLSHTYSRYLIKKGPETIISSGIVFGVLMWVLNYLPDEYGCLARHSLGVSILFATLIPFNKIKLLRIRRNIFTWGNLFWVSYTIALCIVILAFVSNYKTRKTISNFIDTEFQGRSDVLFINLEENLLQLEEDEQLSEFDNPDSLLHYTKEMYFSSPEYKTALGYKDGDSLRGLRSRIVVTENDLDNWDFLEVTESKGGLSIFQEPIYYIDIPIKTRAGVISILGRFSQALNQNENYVIKNLFQESQAANVEYAVYTNNEMVKASSAIFPTYYYAATKDIIDSTIFTEKANYIIAENSRPNETYLMRADYYNFFTIVSASILVFIVFFLFYVILQLLFLGTAGSIQKKNSRSARSLNFNQKIFASIAILLSIVLSISILFIIRIYTTNNQEHYNDNFIQNINTMTGILKDADVSKLIAENELVNLINDFGYDFNVYSPQGKLLYTTNETIFDKKLKTRYISATPLQKLKRQKKSIILPENLGKYKYYSGYSYFADESGEPLILNILNLTYSDETKSNINSFINQLSLLIFILLILTLLISYLLSDNIRATLGKLVDQIQDLDFRSYNKRLSWKQQDEIGLLVKEYNTMLDKLEDNVQQMAETERALAWKDMARQIAHEVKNPLTPMKLNIQHLNKIASTNPDNLPEITSKISKNLIEQIDHLAEISNDFSFFSNITQAKKQPVQLSQIYNSIQNLYSNQENTELDFSGLDQEVTLMANDVQLSKVYINLIKNAIEASAENSPRVVKVSHQIVDQYVVVRVKDFGSGISDEIKDDIFTPNFTTKSSGTGLGLVISKNIIEFHEGALAFNSVLGEGTEFWFSLPIHAIDADT